MEKRNSKKEAADKGTTASTDKKLDNTENPHEITEEDMEALGPKDLSMDMGADEKLKQRQQEIDFSGGEMDVPGSELDDEQEDIGSEDEENNHYSLGGDRKED
ncbi:hypothetical protein [Pleomorphovibrio marinus]|uniref:hypothetical protein n=1 Tax=Pleomorphovibrio marinus TaxID=2164132 RepID=UPI000E0C9073|nr:hypothetical protein [Pleomorphovibrio marinus]